MGFGGRPSNILGRFEQQRTLSGIAPESSSDSDDDKDDGEDRDDGAAPLALMVSNWRPPKNREQRAIRSPRDLGSRRGHRLLLKRSHRSDSVTRD